VLERVIEREAEALATGLAAVEATVSGAVIFRAVVAETAMLSAADPKAIADRAHGAAAAAAHPVWDLAEGVEGAAAAAAVGGEGRQSARSREY
jgi:hypothetical protein